jgi:hypothetical protein
VHYHIGLLIEYYQLFVFVNYIQRYIFGQNIFAGRLRWGKLDYIAWAELLALLGNFPVNLDGSLLYCVLDEAATQIAEPAMQIFVEPAFSDRMANVKLFAHTGGPGFIV